MDVSEQTPAASPHPDTLNLHDSKTPLHPLPPPLTSRQTLDPSSLAPTAPPATTWHGANLSATRRRRTDDSPGTRRETHRQLPSRRIISAANSPKLIFQDN